MGYFDRTPIAPAVPAPSNLQLWDNGRGGPMLAWRRPLGGCDGYVLLSGVAPETLAELARLPGSATRWPVPADAGPWLALACLCNGQAGEQSLAVCIVQTPAPTKPIATEHAEEAGNIAASASDGALDCACCAPARLLVPDDGALACPATGELYAVLATGALARATALPFGLCRCCEARQPLMRSDAAIVCMARPEQRYTLLGGSYAPLPPEAAAPAPLTDPDAIDAALRANSALLGRNGVFFQSDPTRNR